MKTLLILRHAKSDWGDEKLSDHDRPLNPRGQSDAPRIGDLIRTQGLIPNLILSSTAKRARHTAQLAADSCGYEGEIITSREMYLAGPDEYIEAINLMADSEDILMIVGHNPGMEELVDVLTDESLTMTTGNLVEVQLPIQSWRNLRAHMKGKLINHWRPKEI